MALPADVIKLGSFAGEDGKAGTFADATAVPVAADETDLKPRLSGPQDARVIQFRLPRGLPAEAALDNDTVSATRILGEDTKTHAAVLSATGRALSNPETELNSTLVDIVKAVLGGGVENIVLVYKGAMSDLAAPRPTWAGIVEWQVPRPNDVPIFIARGDRTVVATQKQAWTPMLLPALAGWWSAWTTPEGPVSVVQDLSGNARHLESRTGVVTSDADGFNGRPGLLFNGTSSLGTQFATSITGGTVCAWWIGNSTNTAATGYFFDTATGIRYSAIRQGTSQGGKFGALWNTGGTAGLVSPSSDNNPHAFLYIGKTSGASELWIDGVQVATFTDASATGITGIILGDRRNNDRGLTGAVGEMFWSVGTPTAAERTAGFQYLAARAGVSI